jgi:hypothetical protein
MQEHGSADAPDTGRECREGSTENHPFLHKIVKNQRFSEMITRGVEGTFQGNFQLFYDYKACNLSSTETDAKRLPFMNTGRKVKVS